MELFTFTLTAQKLQTILEALSNAPYRVSSPVIEDIKQQMTQHLQTSKKSTDQQPADE